MSKIRLQGNASGTGTLTIASPNTNSDTTVNLPSTLGNAGTSAMLTTDASGNAGLGVTPSAWGSGTRGIDIGSGSAIWNPGSGTQTQLLNNSFNNGTNFIYKNSGSASRYRMVGDQHEWYTAPSGTAGNAISFTQAMTLDASGNLGIGTSSPNPISWGRSLTLNTTSNGAYDLAVNGSEMGYFYANASLVGVGSFANVPLAFYTNNTERMRITSSGSVGIGTTSPTANLEVIGSISSVNGYQDNLVLQNALSGSRNRLLLGQSLTNGAYIYTDAPGGVASPLPLTFWTAGTERARIDASGNLLVQTTSVPAPSGISAHGLVVNNSNNNGAWAVFQSTGASSNRGVCVSYSSATPNDSFNEPFYFRDATAPRFLVKSNGGINNYSANNNNLSDRREKTNFAPAGEYLSKICAIPVQTFNYIDQNMETDPGLTLGVVAQDVQAVAPELVTESNWGTEEEPKMRLSIYQTDLQYALMKCIQEQQAIIEQLKADVAALKGA